MESGSEFHMMEPEYDRLDLNRSILGIGTHGLFVFLEEFIINLLHNVCGAFPVIILYIMIPLLYSSLRFRGRMFSCL